MSGLRPAVLPDEPLYRVHPLPRILPVRPREGEHGRNRWDDPLGQFAVRYAATTLRGCMVELLARFQDDPEAEALLGSVDGVDEADGPEHDKTSGVAEWLDHQRVGRLLPVGSPLLIDIDRAEFLVELDKNRHVRAALDASMLGGGRPAHLDFAIIRLTGPVGRPITQAVSRAIHEDYPSVAGLRYASRIDTEEECWALYASTRVEWTGGIDPVLTVANPTHRSAVQSAAALLEVRLPALWT